MQKQRIKPQSIAHPFAWLLALAFYTLAAASVSDEISLELEDGSEIYTETFPAEGGRLLLWLTSEFGNCPRQRPTAQALAERGVEVWIPDLHAAWFITPGRYSLNKVDPGAVQALIEQALGTGKQVFLMAAGRVNVLALHAVRRLQVSGRDPGMLRGLISVSPRLFLRTPQGGEEAEYVPVARSSNLPIFILQPQEAGGIWRINKTIEKLESGGAPVYLQRLPKAGDGFNRRMEFTPEEAELTARLPGMLEQAMRLLNNHGGTPTTAVPMPDGEILPEANRGAALLKPYPKVREAPPLKLPKLNGNQIDLRSLQGKVVMVNFWATWCPPCVKEIPSLQRLYAATRDRGLEILAVDVGEDEATMRTFLADKPTEFPVLMDVDAAVFKAWGVHAFPTTLILDRQHQIRYAVFGAFEWDSEEVFDALHPLLEQ